MYKVIGADGREYGPVTAEQLREWITQGRANAQTRVQAEGGADWKPLSAFPEFSDVQGAPPARPPGPIPNYLVQAILCTIFCCLPLGIPAIVFAAQVNSKQQAGDFDGALGASRKAKRWCWISFGLGMAVNVIIGLFYLIALAAALKLN